MNLADLIDAITADLTDTSALGSQTYTVWKYVDPPIIRADLGKILAVFPRDTDYDVLATQGEYDSRDAIVVAWYVPVLPSLETGGIGSPEVASAALATAEGLIARCREYAVGIPGFAEQNEATVSRTRFGLVSGGSWMAEITLAVERWPT